MAIAVHPALAEQPGGKAESKTVTRPDSTDVTGAADSTRMSESYEPKGVDLGSYVFFPQLETGETYNSNVYATQQEAKHDFVTAVSPSFRMQSRFANHALNFIGQVDRYFYKTYSKDDHTDASLTVDGRLDVTRETEIDQLLTLFARHEDRGSPDAVASALHPTPTQGLNSATTLKQMLGSWTVGGTVGVDRLTFDNVQTNTGTTVFNDQRNRTQYTTTERAGYEFSPGYSVLGQVAQNWRTYDSLDSSALSRDSHGYRFETGLGVDISQLIKGEVLGGYMTQHYDESTFKDVSGYAMHAALNWTPTSLTLVVPALDRTVEETTTTGVSSLVHTSASVMARHELMRNLILTGYVAAGLDEYNGTGQNAWTYEQRFSATYAFTREVYIKGEAAEKTKFSDVDQGGYRQTQVTAKLGLRM